MRRVRHVRLDVVILNGIAACFRFGRIPGLGGGDWRPDAEVLDLLAIGSCVLGGLLMTPIAVGAVVSMTQS